MQMSGRPTISCSLAGLPNIAVVQPAAVAGPRAVRLAAGRPNRVKGIAMAKGQKKSTREAKKPKADKKAAPVAASTFLRPTAPTKKSGRDA